MLGYNSFIYRNSKSIEIVNVYMYRMILLVFESIRKRYEQIMVEWVTICDVFHGRSCLHYDQEYKNRFIVLWTFLFFVGWESIHKGYLYDPPYT